MLTATNPPMVGIQDTGLHLARRRPWARGLALSAIKGYEGMIGKRTNQLVHLLENRNGTAVVLGEMFDYFRCRGRGDSRRMVELFLVRALSAISPSAPHNVGPVTV